MFLGITVLGGENSKRLDRGIYVKSVTEGGAAARDGRLKAGMSFISNWSSLNVFLLSSNFIDTLDQSNSGLIKFREGVTRTEFSVLGYVERGKTVEPVENLSNQGRQLTFLRQVYYRFSPLLVVPHFKDVHVVRIFFRLHFSLNPTPPPSVILIYGFSWDSLFSLSMVSQHSIVFSSLFYLFIFSLFLPVCIQNCLRSFVFHFWLPPIYGSSFTYYLLISFLPSPPLLSRLISSFLHYSYFSSSFLSLSLSLSILLHPLSFNFISLLYPFRYISFSFTPIHFLSIHLSQVIAFSQ